MSRLPLARRFFLLLAIPSAVTLTLGVWMLAHLRVVPDRAEALTRNLETTLMLNHQIHREVQRTLNLIHAQLEGLETDFPERFHTLNYKLGEMEVRYLTLDIGERERLAVERIRQAHAELGIHATRIYSLLETGERERALVELERVHDLARQVDQDFTLLNDLQLSKLDNVMGSLRSSLLTGYRTLLGLGAGFLLLLGLMALELRHRILDPVQGVLDTAERIREGDHDARAPVLRDDELGRLARGFNFMADRLVADQAELEQRVEERTRQIQELQESLVQSAKLSALGELVGGVAHELNNPLTAILGFAELSRDTSRERGAGPAVAEMQETIVEQVRRCERIIGALTQFARRQKPELETVRLNALVDRVLALREYALSTRNITLVRDFDPSDPALAADPYKLEQVVMNLVNNAHDAIRQAGRSGTIRVSTRADASAATLVVEDDGTGMEEPMRVFEPFYTTKEVGQGTGLGLSVCYGIVDEHGGTIRAENLARGARFTVELPRNAGVLAEAKPVRRRNEGPRAPARPAAAGGSALVVEDEPLLLDLQRALLRGAGLHVLEASSAEEAIELLSSRQVDLVISDVRMPGHLDGFGLYRWVLAHRPDLRRRFVFITGDVMGLENEALLQEHAVPLLHKPFTAEVYTETIGVLVERYSVLRESPA